MRTQRWKTDSPEAPRRVFAAPKNKLLPHRPCILQVYASCIRKTSDEESKNFESEDAPIVRQRFKSLQSKRTMSARCPVSQLGASSRPKDQYTLKSSTREIVIYRHLPGGKGFLDFDAQMWKKNGMEVIRIEGNECKVLFRY